MSFLVLLFDNDDTTMSSSPIANSSNSRRPMLLFAISLLLVLCLLVSTAMHLLRRRHDRNKVPTQFLTKVPVFFSAGADGQRAALSSLKNARENYRMELSVRMKVLDDMVHVHLPGWENDHNKGGTSHLTARLQARIWQAFEALPECWQQNDDVLTRLLSCPDATTALPMEEVQVPCQSEKAQNQSSGSSTAPNLSSYNDAVQVFTHLYRDWTADGQQVRRKTYAPILRAIGRHLLPDSGGGKILVPGAGLGRLAFELAVGGNHHVTALDISPVMVAAAASVLGLVLFSEEEDKDSSFYPFLHDPLINQRSHSLRFRAVTFPDADSRQQVQRGRRRRRRRRKNSNGLSHSYSSWPSLALEIGDLVQLATQPAWQASQDALVTCFFIDTGRNVLSYLSAIQSLLKPGGVWINMGPLNYHQTLTQGAVQLTVEELELAAEEMGLEKVEGWVEETCAYRPEPSLFPPQQQSAFLRVDMYQPVFGVYRKKEAAAALYNKA